MKSGLVLEGGAMRGLFTAGVLDAWMEAGIVFDGAVGVSAGACFGCNYGSSSECENAISCPLFMTGCKEMKTGCKHANDRPFGPLGGPGAVFTCSHPCTSPVWRVSRDRAA